MTPKGKKVFVAMSGGVDSSVSTALLKEEGFDVIGVFIKVWQPEWLKCTWRDERQDAMRVCARLGIPFQTMYLESAYKRHVADYMISEYKSGRTPNPDVMCNKHVKFGAFLEKALEQGADMIATGHYARVKHERGGTKLYAGKDSNKDQSYFLWTLSQEVLQKTLFPVGKLEKSEVRKRAESLGLHNWEKKDSQGICFLGDVDIREFLKRYIELAEGEVLNTSGETIGRHEGALLYTVGQRHGFEVIKKGPNEGAHYVVDRDLKSNTITVSSTYKTDGSGVDTVQIENINWIGDQPEKGEKIEGRIRYRQPLQKCKLEAIGSDSAKVKFDQIQKGVSAGQSLVLYRGDQCLGGGVIV